MKIKLCLLLGCFCLLAMVPVAMGQGAAAAPQAPGAAAQPALPPPPGPPTVTGPSKVAIIDIQQAILTTADGKRLQAALNTRFAPKRTELENAAKDIQTLQNQLNAGGNTMSAEAKNQLTQQVQSKQRDLQQSSDNAQQDFQNAQTDMMNTVGTKMMPIIKKYAEDHGYTAVIDVSMPWPQSPVLYYNPGTVITGDIIRLYDAQGAGASTAPKTGGQ